MKIIHIASEYAPIAKVGGLADVVAGLSKEQRRLGHDVEVILPKYDNLDSPELTLIDLPDDFNRGKIYGEPDDISRFTNFCKAALPLLDRADIIHIHDWQTALLAKLTDKKTVLTLHNMAYQGDGLLEIGINSASVITTVSPTYAKEILTPSFGCGLDTLLKKRPPVGILNGIDTDYWNPQTDHHLLHTYDEPSGKAPNKDALCNALSLDPKKPLFAAICRLVHQKGPELILAGAKHILEKGGSVVILGSSPDLDLEKRFKALSHKDFHLHLEFDERLAHRLYASADYMLIPSIYEPCGLTQLIGMRYGAIPIAHKTGGLADTVIEGKTGFVFETSFTDAIDKALQAKDGLASACMSVDSSWALPAKEYLTLYSKLV